MTTYFDFRTIAELLEDDYNDNIDHEINMIEYEQEKQNTTELRRNDWNNDIKLLEKYTSNDRHKKGNKKNCKCQECIMSDALSGVERILQEAVKQLVELQTKLLKYPGTTVSTGTPPGTGTIAEEIGIIQNMLAKNSVEDSIGGIGIAGGAAGGAGGGFGLEINDTEELGGFEIQSGGTTEIKLGPGVTGGATGGALGSA